MDVVWYDVKDSVNNCVTVCKKNGLIVFKIIRAKDHYFADYYNNNLFHTPILTYHAAAEISKIKFLDDDLENRLIVVKEFFLENYKEQVVKVTAEINKMAV